MTRRPELLEFAVLGLLHESPMHGYELRKRLNTALGAFRALSYGTLYPCLRALLDQGWIAEAATDAAAAATTAGSRRARIVYELTADGKEHFQELVEEAGPDRVGGRHLRRPLRLLRPHRGRGAAAHPRGPPQPARGAARQHPR